MGKVRRERQKFHIGPSAEAKERDEPRELPETKLKPLAMQIDASENIFAGVKIDLGSVNKFVAPKDTTDSGSVISERKAKVTAVKTTPYMKFGGPEETGSVQGERQLTKKEKMKLRHQNLLAKIDVVRQSMAKSKKGKKKAPVAPQQAPPAEKKKANEPGKYVSLKTVQRELVSLNDSLPSLSSVLQFKSSDLKTGLEPPMTLKKKPKKAKTAVEKSEAPLSTQSHAIGRENPKKTRKQITKSYELLRKLMNSAKSNSKIKNKMQ